MSLPRKHHQLHDAPRVEGLVSGGGGSARDVVHGYLAEQVGRFPDLGLEGPVVAGLDGRDAGLAGAIHHAVMRRWLTLKTVAGHFVNRPWDQVQPEVRGVLLAGAAQLLLLERVPDHAVVDEAVRWTKRRVRAKAGGMVNAVLRRVAELRDEVVAEHDPERRDEMPLSDGRAWRLNKEVFHSDPITRLAEQTSHPRKLVERWIGMLGGNATMELARHSLVHAPIVVTGLPEFNPLGNTNPPNPLPGPPPEGEGMSAHAEEGFFVFEGSRNDLTALLEQFPGARVQDAGSAGPVGMTGDLTPGLIMDVCAGRGTKTKQLAGLHPEAKIIATDKDDKRRGALREVFSGSDQVTVVEFTDLDTYAGRADLLILDVPCSNTGVLARRVEAKYRQNEKYLADLVELQRRIVTGARALLSSGGSVLYATCSIEPRENGGQAAWMGKEMGLEVGEARMGMPRGLPGEEASGYADGWYGCLMQG